MDWYDKRGCYSDSAFIAEDGSWELFYTGNVKDENMVRYSYQCLSISRDGGKTFEKQHELNPLIMSQPEGYTAHFRDPKVWEHDGTFYALLGAQRDNLTGAILKYSSPDRRTWHFEGEITFDRDFKQPMGYMWECPAVARMRDLETGEANDVLIFSPQGMTQEGDRFANLYQCGYVVGNLNGTHFTLDSDFIELDAGFEYYAPQPYHNIEGENGEVTVGAWCGLSDQDGHPSWDNHWLHTLTIPRVFALKGGRVMQQPVEQLDTVLAPQPTQLVGGAIPEITDQRVFRVRARVDVSSGPVLMTISDGAGKTLQIELGQDTAAMDRSGNRYTVAGTTRRTAMPAAETRTLDLVVDASVTELFLDGGHTTFTARCYFNDAQRTVRFIDEFGADASEKVLELEAAALNL